MEKIAEIEFLDLEFDDKYEKIINRVLTECFYTEHLENSKFYISVILTTPENIKKMNKEYRGIDKATDVLSFPMFEKSEISGLNNMEFRDVLGDIVISIEKVKEQALEFNHSFERELSYMIVHGFYHLMGEDHIKEEDKKIMRAKEEVILNKLNIKRYN